MTFHVCNRCGRDTARQIGPNCGESWTVHAPEQVPPNCGESRTVHVPEPAALKLTGAVFGPYSTGWKHAGKKRAAGRVFRLAGKALLAVALAAIVSAPAWWF